MRHQQTRGGYVCFGILLVSWFCAAPSLAQEAGVRPDFPSSVMTASEWDEVDQSVERALTWLASQQKKDGSFPTLQNGQPGVTSLCMLAFLSQGHLPGEGEYGDQLKLALDYIVSCQGRSGIVAASVPNGELSRIVDHKIGYTAVYNHAIAALVLSECYAMAGPEQTEKIGPAIEKALVATGQMQKFRKDRRVDKGGWRYLDNVNSVDADLSVTGWQLMFLRSAKNAGFDVEEGQITLAVEYIRRCFL